MCISFKNSIILTISERKNYIEFFIFIGNCFQIGSNLIIKCLSNTISLIENYL